MSKTGSNGDNGSTSACGSSSNEASGSGSTCGSGENEANDGRSNNSSSSANVHVAATKIKISEFFVSDPELWFVLLESNFAQSRITSDNSKYHLVVASLTQAVAERIKDLLLHPPTDDKYDKLKTRLIKDFSDSEATKIKKLLSDIQLGDQKPSVLL